MLEVGKVLGEDFRRKGENLIKFFTSKFFCNFIFILEKCQYYFFSKNLYFLKRVCVFGLIGIILEREFIVISFIIIYLKLTDI